MNWELKSLEASMCGITGYIDYTSNQEKDVILRMTETLHHRGPDDLGVETIESANGIIGLGQARLSIIDLSPLGHQPMSFEHLTIVYNGEVYNYQEIKTDLVSLGHQFEGNSDTEVILHAFYEWGEKAVHRFIGMFAIALYDAHNQTLELYRDRTGVKPLFYYLGPNEVVFGSELKSLVKYPNFQKQLNKKVLPQYLNLGYIPAPDTIYTDCYKLLPGHCFKIELITKATIQKEYWRAEEYYSLDNKLQIDYREAKSELKSLFKSAFNYRMVSDVPVGVFLSGGYDSTAVTSIIQTEQTDRLKTFTIGFEEGNNEAPQAKEIARHLGTHHTEYICTSKEAQDIIPSLPYYYDEPFGDSSTIPTTLVSQLARKDVTVALSADGGDEVFCGYGAYFKLNQFNDRLQSLKRTTPALKVLGRPIKEVSSLILSSSKSHQVKSVLEAMNDPLPYRPDRIFHRAKEKPSNYISNFFKEPVVFGISPYEFTESDVSDFIERAMLNDYKSYLPDDILTKVDRATMSVSLEGREPLLDHRILEFAARLPLDYKYGGGQNGKVILKDIVHDYVPKSLMDRPKSGFSLPIYSWLRGDLSYLLDEYMSVEALSWSGIWDEKFVFAQVKLFRERKLHYVPLIWYILMFQMWYKRWMM